jgi:hypothetical protein
MPNEQLWYLLNTAPAYAGGGGSQIQPLDGYNNGGGGQGGPTINNLTVTYNGQKNITLSGMVTDNGGSPAGLTVTFTGEAFGTTTTDSSGKFSFTTNALALGAVSAATTDAAGRTSPTATMVLQAVTPAITNFAAVEGSDEMFTFSGNVSALTPNGLTVTLGGISSLNGQTATANSNGSFQLIVHLNSGSDNGTATAQTTDWWGQQSNQATVSVTVT